MSTASPEPSGSPGANESPDPDEVRRLLDRLRAGDETADGDLLPLIHGQLHGLARKLMSDERRGHTLQTTALVNEAWMRLSAGSDSEEDHDNFLRVAARAMRQVLIDHARAKATLKRGGDRQRLEIEHADDDATLSGDPTELLALDEALKKLEEKDPELLRIVELRYFAGLTLEETGKVLGKSVRQVHLAWTFARGWLRRELGK